MTRAALVLIPSAVLLAFAAAQHAEARSKAFCRDFAQGIADRNAGVAESSQPAAADGTSLAAASTTPDGNAESAMTEGAAGNAVLSDQPGNDRWQEIYHRAYAECRAS